MIFISCRNKEPPARVIHNLDYPTEYDNLTDSIARRPITKIVRSSSKQSESEPVDKIIDMVEDNYRKRFDGVFPSEVLDNLDYNNPVLRDAYNAWLEYQLAYLSRGSIDWNLIDSLSNTNYNIEEYYFQIVKL